MLFALKKAIGYVIMPVPVCLLLLVAGGLLLSRPKWTRIGRALLFSGVTLFVLFSNKLFSLWLVRPIEKAYPPIAEFQGPPPPQLAACRYIVVLGGGNGNSPGMPALGLLSTHARSRLAEGIRILNALPESRLIVSGPAVAPHPSHATILARAAISLGVDPARIVYIDHARDTEEEALSVKQLVGGTPVALVTSAVHMPRSMALFRYAGVQAHACPTDYTAHDDGAWHWRDLLFDVDSLNRSSWAVRERVGWLWIWLRGRTGAPRAP